MLIAATRGAALAAAVVLPVLTITQVPVGPAQAADAALTAEQEAAVEELIGRYLLENPEIILESVRAHRERQEQASRLAAEKNLVALRDQIVNDPTSPVAGNPDGDVTIVEFFDYRCGYCKASMEAVRTLIEEDPDVRFVFKEFPILSEESGQAARAALAAQRQGKYFEFHNALMNFRGSFTDEQIMKIAADVGLDTEKLAEDMKDPDIEDALRRNAELAQRLDINGTPSFIVGDDLYPGALDLEALRTIIAEIRAG